MFNCKFRPRANLILVTTAIAFTFVLADRFDFPYPRTRYAAGYSRHAFNAIRIGDSADKVYSLLAKPIGREEHLNWTRLYTFADVPAKFYVEFGQLTRIDERTEQWSLRFPIGTNIHEIEKVLGKPNSSEVVSRRVRLRYSKPLEGDYADYWQRWIFLDETGHQVVGKLCEYYLAD